MLIAGISQACAYVSQRDTDGPIQNGVTVVDTGGRKSSEKIFHQDGKILWKISLLEGKLIPREKIFGRHLLGPCLRRALSIQVSLRSKEAKVK